MMKRSYSLLLLLAALPAFIVNVANGQNIPYRSGHKTWNSDKLGNQRAVVTVTGEGKVAEAVIPWRNRKVTPGQQIIVVDAKTGQQINNVKAKHVSQVEGTIDFEPV